MAASSLPAGFPFYQFNVFNVKWNSKLHEFGVLDRQAPKTMNWGLSAPEIL
jgi:hypothetical protein